MAGEDARADSGRASPVVVVAAAIVQAGRLLVVSKKDAPGVFYLPGGKPEPGESAEQTLIRELGEELGVVPADLTLLGHIYEVAAIENVPMQMTVFTARINQDPRAAAELAALGWTNGADHYAPLLAPAVSGHVIPLLRSAGRLSVDRSSPTELASAIRSYGQLPAEAGRQLILRLILRPAASDSPSGMRAHLRYDPLGGVTRRGLCARRVGTGRLDARVARKTVRAREFQPPSR